MSTRASYLHVNQMYALNLACVPLRKQFVHVYLVGSVLRHKDWRDVDVRCLLEEREYAHLHSDILNVAISEWLRARTRLPVDFQFQFIDEANKEFGRPEHQRSALGIFP